MVINWKKASETPTTRWERNYAISEEYLVAYNGEDGMVLDFCRYSHIGNCWIIVKDFNANVVAWAEITRDEFELKVMLECPNLEL